MVKVDIDLTALEKTIENLEKVAKEVSNTKVEIGIIDGDSELQMKAHVNEYGAIIPVTNKMRAWFAYKGYPLKKTTTTIEIPERSFMRTGQKKVAPKMKSKVQKFIPDVIRASIPISTFMEMIGEEFADGIKEHALSISSPPNAALTTEMKGSSNPLVDEGHLISKIESKVK